MTKAATPRFIVGSHSTIGLYTQSRSSASLGSRYYHTWCSRSCASRWLRIKHSSYITTPLQALDDWLSPNTNKRTRNAFRGQTRGSVGVGSGYSDQNNIQNENTNIVVKLGIGFTQEIEEQSRPM